MFNKLLNLQQTREVALINYSHKTKNWKKAFFILLLDSKFWYSFNKAKENFSIHK